MHQPREVRRRFTFNAVKRVVSRTESVCIWRQSLAKHCDALRGAYLMDISTREVGAATIVDVVGDITLYNSPQVRKVLLDLIKDKQYAARDRESGAREIYRQRRAWRRWSRD